MENKRNIAIIAPYQVKYSETFIQKHKELLKGKIFFYYGSGSKFDLEGAENLPSGVHGNIILKLKKKIFKATEKWYFDQLLLRSLRKNEIDVVLVEYGPTATRILEVLKSSNIPFIVHFHGYDASEKLVIEKNNCYKEVFEYASSVVAVSRKMCTDLLNMGCPQNKLVYNVYGPTPDFLDVKPAFLKPQFISIGRFVDKKAPYYTILAFKEVLAEFPEAQLVMAGSGPLLNTCKNLVQCFGIGSNVTFPGVISPGEYRMYLSQSVAMVQHSITAGNGDSEGTPLSVLEASAAGLPVVSTKHAGISDVIQNNITGYLVEEHDINRMSFFFKKILEDILNAQEMGRKGKENIRKNFTLDRHINTLNEIICKVSKEKIDPIL